MLWVSLDFPCSRDDDDGVVNAKVFMMNTQQSSTFLGSVSAEAVRALPAGHVVALGSGGGQVSILSGNVWLTSSGDPSDHFLAAGESFDVRDSGSTLVETWSHGDPAVIAWQPRPLLERLADRVARFSARCGDLVSPARRVGIVAAVAAVAVTGALFGPVSDSRVHTLAGTAGAAVVLHNAQQGAAGAARGTVADGSNTGDRTPGAASQAHRRAPGAA
jgi:Protein of unknown function (DUF2917)